MDIVIPLTSYSHSDYLELKFALRSIQKHLKGFGDIYLIGNKPEWITNVIHIQKNEIAGHRFSDLNIHNKIAHACSIPQISDPFFFFNDDHFLLENFKIDKFPYHHKGLLQDTLTRLTVRHLYRDVIMNTIRFLVAKKKRTLDFDTHCPIIIKKDLFLSALGGIDWHKGGHGIKSIYANINDIEGSYYPDCKIRLKTSRSDIMEIIKSRSYFSTGDRALGPDMEGVFYYLYPKQSKFEL